MGEESGPQVTEPMAASPLALDVNGNQVFRVSQITVPDGRNLVLTPGDQVFYVGTEHDGQYPSRHTFVVLERVDPDVE